MAITNEHLAALAQELCNKRRERQKRTFVPLYRKSQTNFLQTQETVFMEAVGVVVVFLRSLGQTSSQIDAFIRTVYQDKPGLTVIDDPRPKDGVGSDAE